MLPTLSHRDFVIAMRWPGMTIKVGDLVVVNHPKYKRIIKRISKMSITGNFMLRGDSPNSTPEEAIGWIKKSWLNAKVVYIIPRNASLHRTLN